MTSWEESYKRTRRNLRVRCRRIEQFQIRRDARILDYGCGDGLDLQCFRTLGYGRVIGLDRSAALLQSVRRGASECVVQGDAELTPFADGSFDAVFVDGVLHHLNVDRALAEIGRVLRPGGTLCLIEPRGGWPRRLVDLVTFSPLGAVFPLAQIRYRRKTLRYEMVEYSSWLGRVARLEDDLRQHGFEVARERNSLLSIIWACRRV